MKIVNRLTTAQILISVRGKNGGVIINPDAYSVTIAEIVEHTEPNFAIVECLGKDECSCVFAGYCSLTSFFLLKQNHYLLSIYAQKRLAI